MPSKHKQLLKKETQKERTRNHFLLIKMLINFMNLLSSTCIRTVPHTRGLNQEAKQSPSNRIKGGPPQEPFHLNWRRVFPSICPWPRLKPLPQPYPFATPQSISRIQTPTTTKTITSPCYSFQACQTTLPSSASPPSTLHSSTPCAARGAASSTLLLSLLSSLSTPFSPPQSTTSSSTLNLLSSFL